MDLLIGDASKGTLIEKDKGLSYKLICIDLDGTLLDSKRKISQDNIVAIKKASEKGVKVVITTGRPCFDAEIYASLIASDSFIISANGSVIKDLTNNKILYQNFIQSKKLEQIINQGYNLGIPPVIYTTDRIYISGFRNLLMHDHLIFGQNVTQRSTYVNGRKDWNKVLKKEEGNLSKCLFYNWKRSNTQKIIEALKALDDFDIAFSPLICYEVTNKGINKGRAVERLAKHLNINKDQVMTIGDSENDITMLKYAGLGVAMGNATDSVKVVANEVTLTNDENGVARIIEKYILN